MSETVFKYNQLAEPALALADLRSALALAGDQLSNGDQYKVTATLTISNAPEFVSVWGSGRVLIVVDAEREQ